MTDKPDNPADPPQPDEERSRAAGSVTVDGTSYQISPTAFRWHYQVTTADGKLLGLIEAVETASGRAFKARPATGAGMTQTLMIKIADAAEAAGVIK